MTEPDVQPGSLAPVGRVTEDVIEAIPDGVLLVRADGTILLANRQMLSLFGYERDEMIGHPVDMLVPDAAKGVHEQHRRDFANASGVRSMGSGLELSGRRRDGSELPVEISLSPMTAGGEELFVATVRDVSEQRSASRQLAAARVEQARMAIVADRERIARDLHDRVIQRLFGVGMGLQAVSTVLDDTSLRRRLEAFVDEIDHAIKDLRTAIFTLTAPTDISLRLELVHVADAQTQMLGFAPSITFDGAVDHLDPSLIEHATATLNEALSNVARHARASRVDVRVVADATRLTIHVIDDGIGVSSDVHRGNGLDNMAARAAYLGGACELSRNETRGSTLTWYIAV